MLLDWHASCVDFQRCRYSMFCFRSSLILGRGSRMCGSVFASWQHQSVFVPRLSRCSANPSSHIQIFAFMSDTLPLFCCRDHNGCRVLCWWVVLIRQDTSQSHFKLSFGMPSLKDWHPLWTFMFQLYSLAKVLVHEMIDLWHVHKMDYTLWSCCKCENCLATSQTWL